MPLLHAGCICTCLGDMQGVYPHAIAGVAEVHDEGGVYRRPRTD